jgi:methionyl-tRNA formyltransferase
MLSERLAREGADLVLETLDRLASGSAPRIAQDEAEATYAPALEREDARINWAQPSRDLHNLVRGANPKPGAFTGYRGQTLKVWESQEAKNGAIRGGRPGEIVEIADNGVIVQTGGGGLCLRRIQLESRRAMGAAEFARGRRIRVGEVFE